MRNIKNAKPVRVLSGVCIVAGFLALLLVDARVSSTASSTMALPLESEMFSYELANVPVPATVPASAKPFGMLSSGDALTITVAFPQFAAPVDIYVGLWAEAIANDPLILTTEGRFQSFRAGVTPWRQSVVGPVSETLLTGLPLGALPQGDYLFYAGVSASGNPSAFYVWAADLRISAITGRASVVLRKVSSCDALIKTLQDAAIAEMEETIYNLKAQVRTAQGCIYPDTSTGFSSGPVPPPGGAQQYSTTNVQVPGVDEADFVKNDGSYIYIVADGALQIIDAWPPEQSGRVSWTAIEGEPTKLFVADDHAVVYSSLFPVDPSGPYAEPWADYSWKFSFMEDCTYGYNCDFTGDGRKSKITIFDISDRANPVLERELWFDGSYINSRRIGSTVHTVIVSPPVSFPGVSYWPDAMGRCFNYYRSGTTAPTAQEIIAGLDALESANRDAILAATSLDILPSVREARYAAGRKVSSSEGVLDCANYYTRDRIEGQSFLSLVSLDIHGTSGLVAATTVGRPGAVYASQDSMYVASRQGYYGGSPGTLGFSAMPAAPWESPVEVTIIHKFGLNELPGGVQYLASGAVKGSVLNQFSMDEYNGFFRIATTTGHVPSPGVHSTVSVLQEADDTLELVGQIDNLAPAEDIRSARFDGDRGFLVTFKKTDPLFALDMSVPGRPRVAGELKIPGFSTYMHFMDEDHLLTIGYDAEDHGSFAYFQGIMLQIFDVSDMSAPALVQKEVIGTRGTTSEAATNHMAFNYFAPKDLLAIPATVCEESQGSYTRGSMTFSGLMVYDVTVDGGFSYHDGIPHLPPGSPAGNYLCGSWWTESNSVVERSIFMDDYVFSIARDLIMAGNLNAPGNYFSVVNLISTAH